MSRFSRVFVSGVSGLALVSFTVLASLSVDVVFFFSSRRRHTRFDCDWSSDVCSSDLDLLPGGDVGDPAPAAVGDGGDRPELGCVGDPVGDPDPKHEVARRMAPEEDARSGERRGGEECRSRWWPRLLKKKKQSQREIQR